LPKSFGWKDLMKIHEKHRKNLQRPEQSIDVTFTVRTHRIRKLSAKTRFEQKLFLTKTKGQFVSLSTRKTELSSAGNA
jgi:hypothetical protein